MPNPKVMASKMSNVGKIMRLGSLFKNDNRVLIVAMDHGMLGTTKGIEKIEETLKKVIKGGADAVMVNLGVVKQHCAEIAGNTGLILTIPFDPKYVKAAVKLGANAVKTTYLGPVPLAINSLSMRQISEVAREADEWGVPYLAEVAPVDESGKVIYDVEKVKEAARIGAELGGDFIKTAYTGSPKSFKQVVETCPVPIVIMGGPKAERDVEVLKWVRGCADAGGAGVAIGRNIWEHKDPTAMTRAIAQVLHENASVDEAAKELHGA